MIVSAASIRQGVGDDEAPGKPGRPRIYDPVCTTPGCGRPHRTAGLCTTCRSRRDRATGRMRTWHRNRAAKDNAAA
jgi:hypothetical protein